MAGNSGTILVVDDEIVNRKLLSINLRTEGYTVENASNGRQALEMLHFQPFDVVLLDLMMPEMDGYQVLEEMKKDSDLRHIPVIVISALDKMDSVIRCIEMGATDYLHKPFDPVLLRARVNGSLTSKRMHDMEIELLRQVQQEKQQVQKEKQRADSLLNIVIPLGVALASEQDADRLLEKVLIEAMAFCHADAGTLYTCTDDDYLKAEIMRNESRNVFLGGTSGKPVDMPLLPINEANSQDSTTMSDEHTSDTTTPTDVHHAAHNPAVTFAAKSGQTVNIVNVQENDRFDFSRIKMHDKDIHYRTCSLLVVPLKNPFNTIIGVLELVNAQSPETGAIIPFDLSLEQMIGSLCLLAAVALEAYKREQSLRKRVEELQIEVDMAKAEQQTAEITGSDFFQQLQKEARRLRDEENQRTSTTT